MSIISYFGGKSSSIFQDLINKRIPKTGIKTYIEPFSGAMGTYMDDPNLKFDEVIHKAETAIKCGMKINHYPTWKINPWEQWEDGYIEFFIRMDGLTGGNEIFIWQDIRMKHLPKILKTFAYKLEYWKI